MECSVNFQLRYEKYYTNLRIITHTWGNYIWYKISTFRLNLYNFHIIFEKKNISLIIISLFLYEWSMYSNIFHTIDYEIKL